VVRVVSGEETGVARIASAGADLGTGTCADTDPGTETGPDEEAAGPAGPDWTPCATTGPPVPPEVEGARSATEGGLGGGTATPSADAAAWTADWMGAGNDPVAAAAVPVPMNATMVAAAAR
jgi:hypothetical protein